MGTSLLFLAGIQGKKKDRVYKTIIHTHNIEYQRFKSNGKWWWPLLEVYERNCFKKADIIFCISPEDRPRNY